MSAHHQARISHYKDLHFADSTKSSIETAINLHWLPWCEKWGINPVIATGDPNRGGIFASWFVDMLEDRTKNGGKGLKYVTVANYGWCVREWMQLPEQGQLDPLEAVTDWEAWISGVEMETWEEAEHHPEVPFKVISAAISSLDSTSYMDCVFGVVFLMLFFTMNRSEYPVPKTAATFDPAKHTRWEDVDFDNDSTIWAVGKIKQDRRGRRLGIVDGRKKTIVGDIEGSLFNLKYWLACYLKLRGAGKDGDPFFVNEDGTTLTYQVILDYMRLVFRRFMTRAEAAVYGIHGMRVAGYNCARLGKDPELAQLQGDWGTTACLRYERKRREEVITLPRDMCRVGGRFTKDQGGLPALPLAQRRKDLADAAAAAEPKRRKRKGSDAAAVAATPEPTSPDSTPVRHASADLPIGCTYILASCGSKTYVDACGQKFRSKRLLLQSFVDPIAAPSPIVVSPRRTMRSVASPYDVPRETPYVKAKRPRLMRELQ